MRKLLTIIAALVATMTQAQGVIDVHSHIITPEFVSALESEGRLLDEGFPLPKYNVKSHLKWMDEAGVQTSVLTLAAPQPASTDVVRHTNEAAAHIKKEHPGRFHFCAALPLPDVNGAIREAIYALDTLKADGTMLVRIAEIEVYPEHLEAYLAAATEIQQKSLAEEPGVLCLFPNQMKEDNTQIRILEIYASQQAYQHHIQTAHFQKYKQGTLHMVKSLKLQDLTPLAPETMSKIFKRLQ